MLIDSNVIIYALNKTSFYYKKARSFIYTDPYRLIVAHQNIFECLRVLTHKTFPNTIQTKEAVEKITLAIQPFTVISPTKITATIALQLIHEHNLAGNAIFDAYLVATMISNDVDTIATSNEKHFSYFSEIKVVNPFK